MRVSSTFQSYKNIRNMKDNNLLFWYLYTLFSSYLVKKISRVLYKWNEVDVYSFSSQICEFSSQILLLKNKKYALWGLTKKKKKK